MTVLLLLIDPFHEAKEAKKVNNFHFPVFSAKHFQISELFSNNCPNFPIFIYWRGCSWNYWRSELDNLKLIRRQRKCFSPNSVLSMELVCEIRKLLVFTTVAQLSNEIHNFLVVYNRHTNVVQLFSKNIYFTTEHQLLHNRRMLHYIILVLNVGRVNHTSQQHVPLGWINLHKNGISKMCCRLFR